MNLPEKRPDAIPAEAFRGVAEEMVRLLENAGLLDDMQRETAISDLVKHARCYMDGYELAKRLDQTAHWDCDLEMAEELDAFSSLHREALRQAQKDWAARNAIEPPFPVGTRVTARWGRDVITGTIASICEHGAAQYALLEDGKPESSRPIVNFEDVHALEEPA